MQIKTGEKTGLELSEFKGEYSLIACNVDGNGKLWQTWGKAKVGKDSYAEVARPFKVILGDKATAIKAMQQIIAELGA